jgi:hypothetical protein
MIPKTYLKTVPVLSMLMLLTFMSACQKGNTTAPDTAVTNKPIKTISDAKAAAAIQSVCYVEVNTENMLDVGDYTLANGKQLFSIGIIFAANINYNTTTQSAVLYYNTQVTNVLTNAATYIKPLQAKGIKVLLSILGNHEGAGISNFATQAAATAFAQQLSTAVTTYGLDGIDFDDEYADYGTNGTGQPNAYSFVYLVTALHKLMPTKIISFYNYGPAASYLSYGGVTVGSQINYSWNPIYGTYAVPNIPGLTKAELAPAAVDIQNTASATAKSLATKTVKQGYGCYMFYNIPDGDDHTYLSTVSQVLYKQATVYKAN